MLPSAAAAAVLEDGNLVSEILLRLPPQPSSLPRASAVCKSLRSVASDPGFSRRFRIHHRRNRPLLGFFMRVGNELRLEPTLDPPNRVPQGRFPFPIDASDLSFRMLGCRHGFLLMLHTFQGTVQLLVWDPFNGHEHPLAIPPVFGKKSIHGAVLRAAPGVGDIDHFQVVLVRTDVQQGVVACVYSSETGVWGNLITSPLPSGGGIVDPDKPAVLVGDSLYMLLLGIRGPSRIIEFDVGRQSLAVIPLPASLDSEYSRFYSVMRADGGGLGMVSLSASGGSAQLWKRKTSCEGVDSWMLARTVELDKLIGPYLKRNCFLQIAGLAEENNVVFLSSGVGVFMVQLDSLQFKRLPEIGPYRWHPFESVYAAGI
ncbi:hypothetical protein ACQ4PT_005630 [Festuca glaucescens]